MGGGQYRSGIFDQSPLCCHRLSPNSLSSRRCIGARGVVYQSDKAEGESSALGRYSALTVYRLRPGSDWLGRDIIRRQDFLTRGPFSKTAVPTPGTPRPSTQLRQAPKTTQCPLRPSEPNPSRPLIGPKGRAMMHRPPPAATLSTSLLLSITKLRSAPAFPYRHKFLP